MKANLTVTSIENTDQIHITIPQDRLELRLKEYKDLFANLSNWTVPLGIFVSLFLSSISATYSDFYFVKKEQIKAFVDVCAFISFCWLVYAVYVSWKMRNEKEISTLIEKIKLKH